MSVRTQGTKKIQKMTKMGMLIALSIVMVTLIHFPIFPAVAFLEYDPADVSILIGTFAFGPWTALFLTVIVSFIQGFSVSAASGIYGIIMHVIATGVLSFTAGWFYQKRKTKKNAVIGLLIGTVLMAVVMCFANIVITPFFMGVTVKTVWALMPFIIAFNVLKAGINSCITFLLYKRISVFLQK